ncbi:MAG: tRNA threonylcarbamoyladenosine dehydratase [Clostridia bacterium]|nr:tRNA threonylcarbamoyladenosine dehydratase [Clostridia bacterium]
MMEKFSRTALLLGKDSLEKLNSCKVIVFGVGGVGGYVVEGLARSGVGQIDVVDDDDVSLSNINRQIIATVDTVGKAKVDVIKRRILSINPNATVNAYKTFFTQQNADQFDLSAYDYVVDAIDTVTGKIELCVRAQRASVPIISSMGAGNKLDPTAFEVTDVYKTSVCPLAKVMRRELKERGVKKLKVVYSKEEPIKITDAQGVAIPDGKRQIPGSVAFVPSVVGLIIAGEVIKDLIK